ncbi:MAG: hypothetical protein WBF56_09165 [Candidatus Acidiferrales bacterium]
MIFRMFALASLLLLSFGLRQQKTRAFADDEVSHQGKRWLSWSTQERDLFLEGYLTGLADGHDRGCLDYEVGTPYRSGTKMNEKSPVEKCLRLGLKFHQPVDYYEGLMTKYYTTYPEDENLPIRKLLTELSATKNQSLAEIHGWYHSPE